METYILVSVYYLYLDDVSKQTKFFWQNKYFKAPLTEGTLLATCYSLLSVKSNEVWEIPNSYSSIVIH